MVYDLIIIGGGPAGYRAAERAGHEGLGVLLIEKRNIGGVCLNEGCIPSKALLYCAKAFEYAKNGAKYGVLVSDARLDHSKVMQRKDRTVKVLVAGVKAGLKKSGVTIAEGSAHIAGRNAEGFEVAVGDDKYTAKRLLVASGSVPVVPPVPGLKEGLESGAVITSREIFELKAIPASLAIIGGGVIGLEMASYFNTAGSRVTVIEMLDHIAGNTDSEVSATLLKNLRKKGVEFRLGCKVVGLAANTVSCTGPDGRGFTVDAEKVLLSVGRKPAADGLGLENIGVEVERGGLKTDERCRTNVPGVYGAGDVNGVSMLAHTAYREAEVCINDMLGKKDIMRYNAIPAVVYTNPEAAGVGETEESARQKGIEYNVVTTSMRYSGRYVAENEDGDGVCRILTDKRDGRLIGVHMIGSYASEIIYGAALMIENELRVKDVRELVFPHPTVCEVIKEGVFSLEI